MLYLCYLVRPETIPLLLISFEMGCITKRVFPTAYLYALLCQTVFFYQGQSSNISSIDIAIGYKGLSSYNEAFVGFQIFANFYAAPIAFTFGYLKMSDGFKSDDWIRLLSATLQLRSVIMFSSLAGMISLSGHLFMFSVLAPKLICELLHMISILSLIACLFVSSFLFQKARFICSLLTGYKIDQKDPS
ncbi:unnamed protein product [Strongylus vulgaris]|uniref:GPI ethanolamine phosphate transferase 2 C-terminal domain-containing protein n=1 Tax=Strongylus vulgaris TaxID=40348 RepID=A0A3P7KMQ8_STRVU|nr:unnamed protein product [Strongylus vulgaris]